MRNQPKSILFTRYDNSILQFFPKGDRRGEGGREGVKKIFWKRLTFWHNFLSQEFFVLIAKPPY